MYRDSCYIKIFSALPIILFSGRYKAYPFSLSTRKTPVAIKRIPLVFRLEKTPVAVKRIPSLVSGIISVKSKPKSYGITQVL